MLLAFKKVKRTGSYRRNLKKEHDLFKKEVEQAALVKVVQPPISSLKCPIPTPIPLPTSISIPMEAEANDSELYDLLDIGCASQYHGMDDDSGGVPVNESESSDEDDDDMKNAEIKDTFQQSLRNWALQFRINHLALNGLLEILRSHMGNNYVPATARTLLRTTPTIIPVQPLVSGGEYWHSGLKKCLVQTFGDLDRPISISLNINIDGLPVFRSSSVSFWPILFDIFECPKISPMVVGIYCGASKISDIGTYFSPVVDELEDILANGLHINSHKITVALRCFVCDSPARAFVKGRDDFIVIVIATI